jgi:hypothetical protein
LINKKVPVVTPSLQPNIGIKPAYPKGFIHDLTKPALPIVKDEEIRGLTTAQVEREAA